MRYRADDQDCNDRIRIQLLAGERRVSDCSRGEAESLRIHSLRKCIGGR